MKVYGPRFEASGGGDPYPLSPIQFESLSKAKECFSEFIMACDNFGLIPRGQWLYIGELSEVECINGVYMYPDYPDYILSVGSRGGTKISRA